MSNKFLINCLEVNCRFCLKCFSEAHKGAMYKSKIRQQLAFTWKDYSEMSEEKTFDELTKRKVRCDAIKPTVLENVEQCY